MSKADAAIAPNHAPRSGVSKEEVANNSLEEIEASSTVMPAVVHHLVTFADLEGELEPSERMAFKPVIGYVLGG
ncbi:MAG TPA: hypothetical protein VFA71_15480 [Terriglobales bacterium]|nr:hypothetical protein [Terriglobales bacterium]